MKFEEVKMKFLFVFCAIFGAALATMGSELEEDNFRMLNDDEDDVKVVADEPKILWSAGEKHDKSLT